jgi:hypothetical protein
MAGWMWLDFLIIIGKQVYLFLSGMTFLMGEKVARGQVPLKILCIGLDVTLSQQMESLSAGRFTLETA